jgi:type II secretory pathway component GspD/PulD (secretin)
MKMLMLLVCAALSAGAADQQRVFRFSHTESLRDLQEIATIVRSIGEVRDLSLDSAQRSLTMRGTEGQVAMSEWLFHQLDQPLGPLNATDHVYRAGSDDIVRVFYLANAGTVQALQEISTVVRSITEVRRAFTYNTPRVVVLRATADQIGAAEWLFRQLDQPSGAQRRTASTDARGLPGAGENAMRTFFPSSIKSLQDLQEIATVVRSVGEIRRAFVAAAQGAIVMRGTPDQMAMAEWLVPVLEKSSSQLEHRIAGQDELVRVFPLKTAGEVQRLHEISAEVRAGAQIPRGFAHTASRSLIVRGTPAQITRADDLVREKDR